ncbi:MAG: hypothetical protein NTU51_07235 [Bacteroidetes bacterium]|nr:hypothetical protein [Bacteroidota bacterium]
MKWFTPLLLATLVLFTFSCKKSQEDNTPELSFCKLLSVYYNTDSIRMYHYNANGQLVLKWDLFEQGPAFLSSHYVYQNNKLAFFYRSTADSTFFVYDSYGRIISYERHTYPFGGLQIRRTSLSYNSQNQVILETDKAIFPKLLKGVNPEDSIVYTYENQNIKTKDYYWWLDPAQISHDHYEFSYDNGKNSYAVTGEPLVYYLSWNKNNLLNTTINNIQQAPDTIIKYNTSDYPLLIHSSVPYEIKLTYECH